MASRDEVEGRTWAPDGGAVPEPDRSDGPRYRDAVQVGQGSMGRVMGVIDSHLGRRVAYKELRRRSNSATARARFLREARITAQLEHPGIAPVYDVGQDEEGVPWYTMRFVEGRTLADALKASTSLEERLALLPRFVDACQAVAYAHARGIVHRDIKPENVLVGEFGETLVVDWGLAKASGDEELLDGSSTTTGSDASLGSDTTGTRAGTVLGTPNWMSPEQARGEVHLLDARTDVWSLGVILFEILAGSRPFQGRTTDETLERVRLAPLPDLAGQSPDAPSELVAICTRALQRDREARYPTAAELAADVEAFQSGGWVRAHSYTAWERAARWIVRHRLLVGTGLASALALVAVGALSYREVLDERDRAREAEAAGRRHLAEAFAGKALGALEIGDHIQAELFAAAALDLDERADARGVLARTRAIWRPRRTGSAFGPPAGCRAVHAGPDGAAAVCASPEGVSTWSLERGGPPLWTVDTEAYSAKISPDGTRVAAQGGERFSLYDARDGRLLAEHEVIRRGANPRVAWRADGRRIAFARGSTVFVADSDGTVLNEVVVRGTVTDLDWRGDQVFAADLSGHVNRLTAAHDALELGTDALVGNGLYSLATSSDRIAVGTGSDGVLVLDPDTLEPIGSVLGHDGPVMSVAFSPDGHWLVTTGEDRTVRLVAARTGEQAFTLPLAAGTTGSLHFFDDDRLLVSSPGAPGQAWIVPDERPAATLGDHASGLSAVAWHPDGRQLATATGQGRVDLYDRTTPDPLQRSITADSKVVRDVVFGDPRTLISANSSGSVDAWELDGAHRSRLHDGPVILNLDLDPVRGHLYGTGWDGQMRRWESWAEATEVWRCDDEQPLWEVSVSADGSTLAWADGEDELTVVSLPDRTQMFHRRFAATPRASALSPTGNRIAWTTADERIEIRSLPDGALLVAMTGPENAIDDLEFSPDGTRLAAASWDQRAWLWDASTGRLLAVLSDHGHRVVDVEFSPDGRSLATASWDGTARIWDLTAIDADPRAILDELARDQGVRLEGARMVGDGIAP